MDYSPKDFEVREKKVNAFIFTSAIAVALLFHALMLFCFAPPLPNHTGNTVREKKVMMMSFSPKAMLFNRNIKKWIEYGSPSLIAKPDGRYGYSKNFKVVREEKKQEDKNIPGMWEGPGFKNNPFTPLHVSENEILHTGAAWKIRGKIFSSGTGKDIFPKPLEKPETPLWKKSFEEIRCAQLFPENELKALRERIKKLTPSQNTVFEVVINSENTLPRVRTLNSCGELELDREAFDALMLNYGKLELPLNKKTTIKIEWQDKKEP